MLGLAETFPDGKFEWRPQADARSVSEVFVHVATGVFMLLDVIGGSAAPDDLYPGDAPDGQKRFMGLLRKNDELVAAIRDKQKVIGLLKRSLEALREGMKQSSDADLERSIFFFGKQTALRRAYLRLLVHTHEHMGQMVAYLRFNGITVPWPEWRAPRQ
jgi:uncharacterized damage-inducible protein DinB